MKQTANINSFEKTKCIFCEKIANDKDDLIYEDQNTVAFLDLYPVELGHVLVVPKKHSRTWLETDETDIVNTSIIAQKVAQKMQTIFPEIKGYNVIINNEKIANQQIFHFHIHIIPKIILEEGFRAPHQMSQTAKEKLNETRTKIKNFWKNS